MIPLIVSGAVSLASDAISAWKAHVENTEISKAANSADFQQALKTAATQLATTATQQKEQALPGELQSATQQILLSPEVQSMARANPSGSVSLQFNSNGDLFASQVGGGLRRITVGPDVQQQLQELNETMRSPGAGPNAGAAHFSAEIASSHLPVQVNLTAI
jgi:hypothetical protein